MTAIPAFDPPVAQPRKKTKPSFVGKTLGGITSSIEQAIFSEENARRDGFLQRRDPRAKVAAFVLLILATGLSRHWEALVPLYALVMVAALVSRIDMGLFIKRVWIGIPLFSGIVVIPSIFFVKGDSLFTIPLGLFELDASRQGLAAAGIFVLRVGVSVSLAILLILTTRWADVLKSLRFFRVPNIFVLILAMTYRYIFLFLHTVNGMFLARRSRIVSQTTGKEQRWWIVSSMGVLMSRSFRISDEVYQAMLARGFNNQYRTLTYYRMGPVDWLMTVAAAGAATAAVYATWFLL